MKFFDKKSIEKSMSLISELVKQIKNKITPNMEIKNCEKSRKMCHNFTVA